MEASFWGRLSKRFKFSDGGISEGKPDTDSNALFQNETIRSFKTVGNKLDLIGSTGTAVYRGYLQEDYLAEMRGRRRAEKLDQMRRSDAVIKMLLSAIMNLIKSANWEFQPSEEMENQDEAQKHSDFMSHILFNDLDRPWEKKLGEILTFLIHGHSVFERTHKIVDNHPKWGSYVGYKSLGFRSQRTIERWNVDDVGDLVSVTQYAFGDLQRLIDIPAQYLTIFNVDQEGSNFEGISPLRVCYGPWKRKDLALKLNIIGIEKYAVPTPIGTVPAQQEGLDRFDKFKEILEKYTSHETNYITVSEGWKIDMHSNVYDPAKVIQAIQFENTEMACAFLAQFLLLGQGASSGGSYALSNDQSDFMTSGLDSYCKEIEGPINSSIVKEMIDLNFGPQAGYPKLTHSDVSDKAGKELSEVLKFLIDSKAITPDTPLEQQLRKRYHLPVMDETTQRQVTPPPAPNGLGAGVSMAERIKNAIKLGLESDQSSVQAYIDMLNKFIQDSNDLDILAKQNGIEDDADAQFGGPGSGPQGGAGSGSADHLDHAHGNLSKAMNREKSAGDALVAFQKAGDYTSGPAKAASAEYRSSVRSRQKAVREAKTAVSAAKARLG